MILTKLFTALNHLFSNRLFTNRRNTITLVLCIGFPISVYLATFSALAESVLVEASAPEKDKSQRSTQTASENRAKPAVRSGFSPAIELALSESQTARNAPYNASVRTFSKTTGPDKNPLKGWNSAWFNDAPESSVGYQYLPWKEFEPQNGEFSFEDVERIMARSGSQGRHVVLRLYCDWHGEEQESHGCPDWIYSEVGVARLRGSNGRYITDFNDPNYLNEATQAIEALGARYDLDPRIHSFQIGVLGYWGEWHSYPFNPDGEEYTISRESQEHILTAYRNAFPNTKLVARYPWYPVLDEANDLGFHNDFFHSNSGHSDEFDVAVDEREKWKLGPIGGEIPPELNDDDYTKLYLTSKGTSMIQTGRYSTMKPDESIPIASQHRESHMRLHRLMGYNFQIDQAEFASQASGSLPIVLDLANVGVAPLYYDWEVQFGLLEANSNARLIQTADSHDLTQQMPNDSFQLTSTLNLNGVAAGDYQVAVRIIQPGANTPKAEPWKLDARNTYIQFANEMTVVEAQWDDQNRLIGGWSLLGNVKVN